FFCGIHHRTPLNISRFSLHFPSCLLSTLYDEYRPLSRPTPELHGGPETHKNLHCRLCSGPTRLPAIFFKSPAHDTETATTSGNQRPRSLRVGLSAITREDLKQIPRPCNGKSEFRDGHASESIHASDPEKHHNRHP